jgi:hypothetical protein
VDDESVGMIEDTAEAMRLLCGRFPDMKLVYGVPFSGPASGELTVGVGVASCVVERSGAMRWEYGPAKVSADEAGDLAYRPEVRVILSMGDPWPAEWLVMALGFVEAEAEDACKQVAAAVPRAWATAMTRTRSAGRRRTVVTGDADGHTLAAWKVWPGGERQRIYQGPVSGRTAAGTGAAAATP